VYGLVGIQAHAKICVVIRNEDDGLRHYVHLSTGNYNVDTARAYTDLDLLTAHDELGRDASQLINLLTGFSSASLASGKPQWKHFIVAPFDLHRGLIAKIDRETKHAKDGKPARITAKVNALVDPPVIEALYRAGDGGVKVDLIVRGMCCIPRARREHPRDVDRRPLPRALAHRALRERGQSEVYLSSGDWMPRNFTRRVE
jgi:polyphosphate kinase